MTFCGGVEGQDFRRVPASRALRHRRIGWLFLRDVYDAHLDYLNARYLDPTLGRFISVDPLISMTRDAYGYGNNNPITFMDPTGLCSTVVNGEIYCNGGTHVSLDGSGTSELVDIDPGSGGQQGRVFHDSAGGVTKVTWMDGRSGPKGDFTDAWRRVNDPNYHPVDGGGPLTAQETYDGLGTVSTVTDVTQITALAACATVVACPESVVVITAATVTGLAADLTRAGLSCSGSVKGSCGLDVANLVISVAPGDKAVLLVIKRTGGPAFAKEAYLVITNVEAFKQVLKKFLATE